MTNLHRPYRLTSKQIHSRIRGLRVLYILLLKCVFCWNPHRELTAEHLPSFVMMEMCVGAKQALLLDCLHYYCLLHSFPNLKQRHQFNFSDMDVTFQELLDTRNAGGIVPANERQGYLLIHLHTAFRASSWMVFLRVVFCCGGVGIENLSWKYSSKKLNPILPVTYNRLSDGEEEELSLQKWWSFVGDCYAMFFPLNSLCKCDCWL